MTTSSSQAVASASDTWTADDGHTAIYDPVPSSAQSTAHPSAGVRPHAMEMDIQRALLNLPEVRFSSLRVHRLPDGICLTGIVQVPPGPRPRFDRLVREVAGVERVLNHLVMHCAENASTR